MHLVPDWGSSLLHLSSPLSPTRTVCPMRNRFSKVSPHVGGKVKATFSRSLVAITVASPSNLTNAGTPDGDGDGGGACQYLPEPPWYSKECSSLHRALALMNPITYQIHDNVHRINELYASLSTAATTAARYANRMKSVFEPQPNTPFSPMYNQSSISASRAEVKELDFALISVSCL